MRRQYITHPKFQISFTVWFVLGVLSIVFILGLTSILTLHFVAATPTITEDQRVILRSGAQQIVMAMLILALILTAIFSFVGVYLSYKFVGPLSRLEQWLERYIAGENLPYLKLRKGDELEPAAMLLFQIIDRAKMKKR
jgi:signal peptidase II